MARDMAEFVARILVREGCWVVEPTRQHNDSYLRNLFEKLRHIPVRIYNPPNTSLYKFAERGQDGSWFFVWVPEEHN
jgi:hypothetical protein